MVRYDIVMSYDVVNPIRKAGTEYLKRKLISEEELDETMTMTGDDTPIYNTGVILFKNTPRVQELFEIWKREWEKYRSRDEWALARAIEYTGIPVAKLPRNYNFFQRWARPKWATKHKIVIMHFLGDRGKQAWEHLIGSGE